jgi:hypothetical protein
MKKVGIINSIFIWIIISLSVYSGCKPNSSKSSNDLEAPDAPVEIAAATIGSTSIQLSWTASINATSYNIYWSTSTGVTISNGIETSGVLGTSYTYIGLTEGQTYYFIVTAVNSYGESEASSQVSGKPTSATLNNRYVLVGPTRTYTSIKDALNSETDFQSGENNIILLIDSGVYDTFTPNLKFSTSANHKLILKCAAGGFHNYQRDNGVIIKTTGSNFGDLCLSICAYSEYHGIAFTEGTGVGAWCGFAVAHPHVLLDSCFVYDIKGSNHYAPNGTDWGIMSDGIVFSDWYSGSTYGVMINCAAVNCSGVGLGSQTMADGDNQYVYNSISLNCSIAGFAGCANGTQTFINCYAGGCGVGIKPNIETIYNSIVLDHVYTDDGSQASGVISVVKCYFANWTAGSENINISSTSYLKDAGTSLASDSIYAFAVDGFGNSRPSGSAWDIGPIECR